METLIPGMLLWICLQLGCEVPPLSDRFVGRNEAAWTLNH